MAFLMVVIWGSAFTLVSIGVLYISPLWLVTYRLIIGAILIIIYVLFKGLRLPNIKDVRWVWYFAMGLIGMVIPFFLLSTGSLAETIKLFGTPPIKNPGAKSLHSKIQANIEEVVVLPWVPATARTHLSYKIFS